MTESMAALSLLIEAEGINWATDCARVGSWVSALVDEAWGSNLMSSKGPCLLIRDEAIAYT